MMMRALAVLVAVTAFLCFGPVVMAAEDQAQGQTDTSSQEATSGGQQAAQQGQPGEQGATEGRQEPGKAAEQAKLEYDFEAALASNYFSRGSMDTDGAVFQPSFTITQEGLSANVWGNLDISNVNKLSGKFTEMDLTVDYTHPLMNNINCSTGVAYSLYPHTGEPGSAEVYAGLEYEKGVDTTLTAYYDFDRVNGTYVTLEVERDFPLKNNRTLHLEHGIGWANASSNMYNFGVHKSGFTDMHFTVGLSLPTKHGLIITPQLTYSRVLDGTLRKTTTFDDVITFAVNFAIDKEGSA
jgi:hypothetical protein